MDLRLVVSSLLLVGLLLWVAPPGYIQLRDPFPAEPRGSAPYVASGQGFPEPSQTALPVPQRFEHDGHVLLRRAEFRVEARVLRSERYRFDATSDVSPIDLMLGWGAMSENPVLSTFRFRQSGRWGFWQSDGPLVVSRRVIEQGYSNFHMIPADGQIEDALFGLRAGESVQISGYLVDVSMPGGATWSTSLSRNDTGDGACEILFATGVAPL